MIFLLILSLFSVLNAADQIVINEGTPSNPFVLPVEDMLPVRTTRAIEDWIDNHATLQLSPVTENIENQVTIPNSVTSFCTTDYVIGGFIGLTFCGVFIFVVVLLESFANPNNV